jgi:hypothetical protein
MNAPIVRNIGYFCRAFYYKIDIVMAGAMSIFRLCQKATARQVRSPN